MVILGISPGHNASAALMVDGRIVGMLQEERLTRIKNQTGFPKRAIESLVADNLEGDFSRIDRIGYAGQIDSIYWTVLDRFSKFGIHDYVREMHEYWYPLFYGKDDGTSEEELWSDNYWHQQYLDGKMLNENHNYDVSFLDRMGPKEAFNHFNDVEKKDVIKRLFDWHGEVEFLEHHSCHAHWALYGSDLSADQRKDSVILTADSRGDNHNWTVSVLDEKDRLQQIAGGLENNVARLYKYVTLILGMKPDEHEYKVMGLSSYSTSKPHIEAVERVFFEALDFRDGSFVKDKPLKDSYFDLKNRLEGFRFDNIAAGLQNWSASVTKSWVNYWLKKTGKKGVCFSGGLSMNIKANADILALEGLNWLNVPASGGDESLSGGACFQMAVPEEISSTKHVYLGALPAFNGIYSLLDGTGFSEDDFFLVDDFDDEKAALLLKHNEIVARCIGRAEFGARSLGNRSILANPSNLENLKKINVAIKHRDFWMPFAPSILAEYANEYLVNKKNVQSPFMTIGYDSQPDRSDEMVAALHPADRTARPQFVDRATNPEYWSLIDAFRQLTGTPVLLNTSLNLHGEPMNYSVADAVRTVALSDMNFLLLPENKLLAKKSAAGTFTAILD